MSHPDVTSAPSSPTPEACPECDATASVTSDLHKYQVACTCKPSSAQYASADDPGAPPPAKIDTPPALPPRPPTSVLASTRRTNASVGCNNEASGRRRKYAWWCVGCGALAAALGGLLAAQHILLRAYTASPQHLETVPAAVPAAMLVLTGVCIMSLARRRNRYSYMIKVVGACCLVCALTCVLVTITTTVIHMNKLQTLKSCEYTKLTRTCTCYSMLPGTQHSGSEDDGVRCVFEGVTDCGVVHGALYWCLRGVFALSVSAVLVCIFSCMLAYQLLSHERKKMYWEQLELRCRSLYRPPMGQPTPTAGRSAQANCGCCAQCHPTQQAWDISLQHRFWAPGRIGNLYSPNPGAGRKTSAWSWFPWPRSNSQNSRCRMGGVPQSGDSAYGFCEGEAPGAPQFEPAFQRPNYPQNFAHQQSFTQSESSVGTVAEGAAWGPPPPYSPHGRPAHRHHLHHQDPAAATLLHHHHHDVHRPAHDHANVQTHACSRNSYLMHGAPPNDIDRLNPDANRMNPDLHRLNPDLGHAYVAEMARMQADVTHLPPEARFNTLRGHLVPYRCQRLGVSASNLHRDCRMDDNIAIECVHQKSGSRVSDQSSDSCQKQGKENLGFQNDKHSPIRSSMQDCRNTNLNTESEVYFADVSSCCNVSVKADCCVNPNVSALVGTIENHPESTSESDTGSFTLTRQQRPQPQVGSKRRPRATQHAKVQEKMRVNNPVRLTEHQIDQLNAMRINDRDRMNENRMSERMNDSRDRLNVCERVDARICERINDSRDRLNELNDCRFDRNDCRMSERVNEVRLNEIRVCDKVSDARHGDRIERFNESRISDKMNDSRLSDRFERMNDSRIGDKMNESRLSERFERMNDPRMSDKMNDSRLSDRIERINESRVSDKLNDTRLSERMERMNETRMSDRIERVTDPRMSDRFDRMADLNSSIRIEGSPRSRSHMSPLRMPKEHPRQSSSDSKEFFAQPISPLSPKTEESLLSDDDRSPDQVYSNSPETSKCLGPDSQYEPVRDGKEEILKTNHHHCYSDTNTMDSGWQSGSEKQVTD
ncbi:uncharacterized protein LOC101744603 isoform X2 [Bombyx mori]|uniref:Uncharacterized protein n=1 Tax=Bombyx mori TaxID=7091 RepID=A0A8R2M0W4_BOMMO|nr:uncharacterized protein LOC101744603 isoform X2 [Bombyx mori]